MKTILSTIIYFLIIGCSFNSLAQTVSWSVQDTNGTVGDTILVPILLDDDVTGMNVLSFESELYVYGNNGTPIEIVTAGTLAESLGAAASNIYQQGSYYYMNVSAAGTTALTAAGALFYVRMICHNSHTLYFSGINRMNEGNPIVTTNDGNIAVQQLPQITVYPNNGMLLVGDQMQFYGSGGAAPYSFSVSDTSIATIDSTGLLTAVSHGIVNVQAVDTNGYFDWSDVIEVRSIQFIVGDTFGTSLDTVVVPIFTSDLDALNITSGEFTLTHSETNIKYLDFIKSNSMLATSSISSMQSHNGSTSSLNFAFASTAPIAGNNPLLYLRFVIPLLPYNVNASVQVVDAVFNQGLFTINEQGNVFVTGIPLLSISPASNQNLFVGESIQFNAANGDSPYQYTVIPSTAGTIDPMGFFTAQSGGLCRVVATDQAGQLAESGAIEVFDGELIVDSRCANVGDTVLLPIFVSQLPDSVLVNAYEFTVSFNKPELDYLGYEKLNTMSENWSVISNNLLNGDIKIVSAGMTGEAGGQVVLYLKFIATANFYPNEFANVQLNEYLLNEGSPHVDLLNGGVRQSYFNISNILPGYQSACDTSDNTYDQELILFFDSLPASGNIIVNDSIFAITSNPQHVLLTKQVADGKLHHVSANVSTAYSCDFNFYNIYTAPESCVMEPIFYVFVDSSATGTNNGASWLDAYTNLQDALALAEIMDNVEIWVAKGTYYPTSSLNRSITFEIPNAVSVYGGFVGDEVKLVDRNTTNFGSETILSGDLNNDGLNTNNSYHVLSMFNVDSTTTLDGFTVRHGHANGSGDDAYGGGIFVDGKSNPYLKNLVVIENTATSGGGGLYNNGNAGRNASPSLLECAFVANSTNGIGGAILNNGYQGTSSPIIANCFFNNNQAISGAGIYNNGFNGIASPIILNNIIDSNIAINDGGAIFNNGRNSGMANPKIIGNKMIRMLANRGGAIFNDGISGECAPQIIHNTIAWTSALIAGDHIYNQYSDMILGNSILWTSTNPIFSGVGSTDSIFHSIIQGGAIGQQVIVQDPLFIDTISRDTRLQACSPAIDMGLNINLSLDSLDLYGNNRPFLTAPADIGAFEYHGSIFGAHGTVLYVRENGSGTMEGSSWENALPTLHRAVRATPCGMNFDTIWMTGGKYFPEDGLGRNSSFNLKNNLAVYGGFVGVETNLTDRNLGSDQTVLSGDIGVESNSSDNSYHVISLHQIQNVYLDGLVIEDGNADGVLMNDQRGGGILCRGGLTMKHVVIRDNRATGEGSAIYLSTNDGNLIMNDVIIDNSMPLPNLLFSMENGAVLDVGKNVEMDN